MIAGDPYSAAAGRSTSERPKGIRDRPAIYPARAKRLGDWPTCRLKAVLKVLADA
jgi:hypothetical protein